MTAKTPSNKELEQIRSDLEAVALPDTCSILSVTRTPDGQGGFTETWAATQTNVPCRLDGKLGGERNLVIGEGVREYHRWTLTVPYDTTITPSNRIEHNSQTYRITNVRDHTSWEIHRRAELERL